MFGVLEFNPKEETGACKIWGLSNSDAAEALAALLNRVEALCFPSNKHRFLAFSPGSVVTYQKKKWRVPAEIHVGHDTEFMSETMLLVIEEYREALLETREARKDKKRRKELMAQHEKELAWLRRVQEKIEAVKPVPLEYEVFTALERVEEGKE
jgi:hypothetical protein